MKKFLKKYRFEIGLFAAYLLLALVFTWPLVLNLRNSIYGVRGDHFVQLWESWWRSEALRSGDSLTFTPLVYAPSGFDFSSSPTQPLPTVLNLGLTLLTNEVLALNILLLLSFPLSGLAVYFLVIRLLKNNKPRTTLGAGSSTCNRSNEYPREQVLRLAAAFSGLIYAFSMYHFSHAWEHSTLVSIYWMPLYVLALAHFDERKSVKSAILAALCFAIVLLDNFYYGYMMVIFSGFFFLFQARRWLNRRSLKRLFLFFVLCFLFTVPVIFPMLSGSGSVSGSHDRSLHDLNWFAARPWFYFLPSTYHPLWGGISKAVLDWIGTRPPEYLMKPYARVEHNLYLGWMALILSAVAVAKSLTLKTSSERGSGSRRRWVRVFLFLGVTMAIFSAPPMVSISGFKIYFPSHFLHKVLPMFRAYARFGVLALLCVSVLAGFGLKYLLRRDGACPVSTSRRRRSFVFMLSCFLVLLEVLLPPFNVDLTPPEPYLWLRDQPGDFIVAEFPPRTDHSGLLYQRFHGKRLLNPTVENPQNILHAPEDQISAQALLYRDLRERPQDFPPLGVKYVIFHEGDPFLDFNLAYFGEPDFNLVKRFGDTVIYEIMEVTN